MYSYAFSLFFMYGDLDSVIFVMIVETLLWAIGVGTALDETLAKVKPTLLGGVVERASLELAAVRAAVVGRHDEFAHVEANALRNPHPVVGRDLDLPPLARQAAREHLASATWQ